MNIVIKQVTNFWLSTTYKTMSTVHYSLLSVQQYYVSKNCTYLTLKIRYWTSLVAQWLRIRLPMQGTRVQALVREDPTCSRATKPMHHNYWDCTPELASHKCWSPLAREPTCRNYWTHAPHYWSPCALGLTWCNYWARVLQLLKPMHLEPVLHNKRSHHNEKPVHRSEE